ncbi:MAG TPA: dTMP kinase [Candidatus Limnocylindrales bacterium]|nr:dTMP kinase [Candidatus Limnocylindrales bacterium]
MSGFFVSFEGGEGSGKSVQARSLAEWLRERGREVVLTREPGGTAAGERIREILLHAREARLSPVAQALLFSAARAQLVDEVIRPALGTGKIVVADRFFDSTYAYQGYGGGADLDGLRAVTRLAVGDVRPQRTFLLDLPLEVGLARAGRRGDERWDRFESDDPAYHERVRDGYLRLAAAEPGRFVLLRADQGEEAIAAAVRREVDELLGARA